MAAGDLASLHDWLAAAHRAADQFEYEMVDVVDIAIRTSNSERFKVDEAMRRLGSVADQIIGDLPASARAA